VNVLDAMKPVDLRRLKIFAHEKLSRWPVLRELILMEPDKVEAPEFLGKVPVWLKLFKRGPIKSDDLRQDKNWEKGCLQRRNPNQAVKLR